MAVKSFYEMLELWELRIPKGRVSGNGRPGS